MRFPLQCGHNTPRHASLRRGACRHPRSCRTQARRSAQATTWSAKSGWWYGGACGAERVRSALWHTEPCTAADAGAARTACTVCAACVQASTAYPRELSWWERGHHYLAVFLLTVVPLGISRRSLLGLGLLRPLPRGPPRVPGEVQGCRGRRQGRAPHRHRQQRPSGHAQERCDARR